MTMLMSTTHPPNASPDREGPDEPLRVALLPNAVRQRLEFSARFHRALGNEKRILVLTSLLRHGEKGARPSDVANDLNMAQYEVSRSLAHLRKAWLVGDATQASDKQAKRYRPTNMAVAWFKFENIGSPAEIVAMACLPEVQTSKSIASAEIEGLDDGVQVAPGSIKWTSPP